MSIFHRVLTFKKMHSNDNFFVLRIVIEELWDWKEYPSVSYGQIIDFFSNEENEKENEEEQT